MNSNILDDEFEINLLAYITRKFDAIYQGSSELTWFINVQIITGKETSKPACSTEEHLITDSRTFDHEFDKRILTSRFKLLGLFALARNKSKLLI